MNFDLLLTDEEYQQRFVGKQHPTPYVYKLYSDGQMLVYFGARHSRNPDDEQWQELKDCWASFVQKAGQRRIILLEGQAFQIPVDSWLDIIRRFGEAGALIFLAHDIDVKIGWPDLAIGDEARLLMETFEPNLVAYYIFARSAGSWLRAGTIGTFDEVLHKAAETTLYRIPDAPSDVASYRAIHERIFGKLLDEIQKDTLIRASAPVHHDSIINDIARASSRLRNEHIINEVDQYWREGYSIFLLFGAAHAVMQERVLREMMRTKS